MCPVTAHLIHQDLMLYKIRCWHVEDMFCAYVEYNGELKEAVCVAQSEILVEKKILRCDGG